MVKSQIKIGGRYAYRANPRERGSVVEQVEVLAWIRPGVSRFRLVDQHEVGRAHECSSSNLILPWEEHESFLVDEARLLRLLEVSRKEWKGGPDDPVVDAANLVLDAAGAGDWCLTDIGRDAGHADIPLMTAERVLQRCGLDLLPTDLAPTAFVDRQGILHLPFNATIELAKAFIRAEPRTVLSHVRAMETKEEEHRREGKEYMNDLMELWRTAWGLVREWVASERKAKDPTRNVNRAEAQQTIDLLWKKILEIEQRRRIEHEELKEMLARALRELTGAPVGGTAVGSPLGRATI